MKEIDPPFYTVEVLGTGYVKAITRDKIEYTADLNKARLFGTPAEVTPYIRRFGNARVFIDQVYAAVKTVVLKAGKPGIDAKAM